MGLSETRGASAGARRLGGVAAGRGVAMARASDRWCTWARGCQADVLQVKTDTGSFWGSLAPVSCLYNLLLSAVVEQLGPTLSARLAQNRLLQQEFGQFER